MIWFDGQALTAPWIIAAVAVLPKFVNFVMVLQSGMPPTTPTLLLHVPPEGRRKGSMGSTEAAAAEKLKAREKLKAESRKQKWGAIFMAHVPPSYQ